MQGTLLSKNPTQLEWTQTDLYRLVDRFHGTTAAQLEEYRLLERLLREQCHVGKHQDGRPRDDDDDAGECKVPVALKDPKQVSADSLQPPHDPDVTYSGHKGKGYEVQVAETCHEENATQLITHVEVTPSSGSDTDVSVPVVDGLAVELRHAPRWQLVAPHRPAGEAVRALAWLGPEEVVENLGAIEKKLSSRDFEELAASRAVMPAWLAEPVSAMMSDA